MDQSVMLRFNSKVSIVEVHCSQELEDFTESEKLELFMDEGSQALMGSLKAKSQWATSLMRHQCRFMCTQPVKNKGDSLTLGAFSCKVISGTIVIGMSVNKEDFVSHANVCQNSYCQSFSMPDLRLEQMKVNSSTFGGRSVKAAKSSWSLADLAFSVAELLVPMHKRSQSSKTHLKPLSEGVELSLKSI
eukprot:3220417-Amphidinium_carterae.1